MSLSVIYKMHVKIKIEYDRLSTHEFVSLPTKGLAIN